MERVPKGQYVRDGWDWLGADAIYAHVSRTVVATSTGGVGLQNISQAGEYLDIKWIYATVDQAAVFRLVANPNWNISGAISNPNVSYINPIEGSPPAQIVGVASPGDSTGVIHQTAGTYNEFFWPKISFGTFIRIPANWILGINITAGASNTVLQVTWYGQFIQETDIHTGAEVAQRQS